MPEKEQCLDFGNFVFSYGRFHNNFVNKLIHIVFIPVITISGGALVGLHGPYFEFPAGVPIIGQYMFCQCLTTEIRPH